MNEPGGIPELAIAGLSAGAVVLFAACYAALLALGRLHDLAPLRRAALAAYLAMVAATAALAWALALEGFWLALIAVLLVGYYIAPRAIWRLSVATHEHAPHEHAPPASHAHAPHPPHAHPPSAQSPRQSLAGGSDD